MKNSKQTCSWPTSDPLLIEYHDKERGVPVHSDKKLFEFLILEGFQAGLSWLTILRKRENFRRAFAVKAKPDFAQAHYNLGSVYVLFNNIGSALDEYKTLVNIDRRLAYKLFNQIYK